MGDQSGKVQRAEARRQDLAKPHDVCIQILDTSISSQNNGPLSAPQKRIHAYLLSTDYRAQDLLKFMSNSVDRKRLNQLIRVHPQLICVCVLKTRRSKLTNFVE